MDASWIDWMAVFSALGLGLSAGALLAEGAVLVPYWRSLEPSVFLGWYERHGGLLLRFFGPLEVVPSVLILITAAAAHLAGHAAGAWFVLSALLAIAVLASFPLYFRAANESFATGSIGAENVAAELSRWSAWHWGRSAIAVAAFLASLLALEV